MSDDNKLIATEASILKSATSYVISPRLAVELDKTELIDARNFIRSLWRDMDAVWCKAVGEPVPQMPSIGAGGTNSIEDQVQNALATVRRWCAARITLPVDGMEPITLEWLAEVAPEMLDIEDCKPGEYMKLNRGIEVDGGGCYLMCCKRSVDKKWVPIPEVELRYTVGASDYNYEGSTSLDHVTTRDEFRQLVRLLTGREIR